MQLDAMLDLLIGLASMFFLLSLIASSLQEMIAGFFNWRGTYLAKGLDVILDNKPDARFKFTGTVDWLQAHFTTAPGRDVLEQYHRDTREQTRCHFWFRPESYPANRAIGTNATTAQAYTVPQGGVRLTAAIFGPNGAAIGSKGQMLLVDTAIPQGALLCAGTVLPFAVAAAQGATQGFGFFKTQTLPPQQQDSPVLAQVLGVQAHPLLRSTPSNLPSYVPARNFSEALLGVLRDGSQAPLFTQVQNTISALPLGDLKTTLTLFVQDAGGDIDAFRARLETWFDDAMDRVGGIYKRLAQWTMLILGIGIAAGLNASTTHVAAVLWTSPSLRAVLVAQASATVANGRPAEDALKLSDQLKAFEISNLPIGWDCLEPPKTRQPIGSAAKGPAPTVGTQEAKQPVTPSGADAGKAQVPANTAPPYRATAEECTAQVSTDNNVYPGKDVFSRGWYGSRLQIIKHEWLGWLITGFAVSFGAPFWFDLLQNLVNLRNAGQKPGRTDAPGGP